MGHLAVENVFAPDRGLAHETGQCNGGRLSIRFEFGELMDINQSLK
jgi:hypothetical protein